MKKITFVPIVIMLSMHLPGCGSQYTCDECGNEYSGKKYLKEYNDTKYTFYKDCKEDFSKNISGNKYTDEVMGTKITYCKDCKNELDAIKKALANTETTEAVTEVATENAN